MSTHSQKRKVDSKCHVFNKAWTAKYVFTEVQGKAMCLVCFAQVSVLKDYNLHHHYVTKHEEKYFSDKERATVAKLKHFLQIASFTMMQKSFTASRGAAVKTSNVICHKIARKTKQFSDWEFIKKCLMDLSALICPERKRAFENVSLSGDVHCNGLSEKPRATTKGQRE